MIETIRNAVETLARHKMRSFLTLLGVIIGIMTVVSVVSVISGVNDYIKEKVFQLNPDVYIMTQFGIITSRDEFLLAVRRKRIDTEDMKAVEQRCKSCEMVGAQLHAGKPVRYRGTVMSSVDTLGHTANMADLQNLEFEAGRFFTKGEEHHSALVAVIGDGVREELFGPLDPIGRMISVDGTPMKVIGLLKKQGSVLGQDQDRRIHVPITTFRKKYGTRRSLDIFVRAAGGVQAVSASQDEVRVILRSRRKTPFAANDPFGTITAEMLQTFWKNISQSTFIFMVFISGISLVVGAIVIANIMLVSVIERTREIGVRRAMGARQRDIMMQFLAESTVLSLVGGSIGILIGAIISKLIAAFSPLPTLVRPSLVIAGLLIAAVIGIAAGFFPARKAAKLVPVEALRYE